MRTSCSSVGLQIPSTPSPLGQKLVRSSPEDRKQVAGPGGIPNLSLPRVDADAGMPIQLLLQDVAHQTDPIRSADNVHEGTAFDSWMEDHYVVAEKKCVGTDPTNDTGWKHKFGFHIRGVQWDTPMSKWVGEGTDWIQLMAQGPPSKEDVTLSLLATMRQAAEKRTEKGGGALTKKPRDLAPLILEVPTEDKQLMLEH